MVSDTATKLASLERELDKLSNSPLASLSADTQRALAELAQARVEGRVDRRRMLQAGGALGFGALLGGGAVVGSAGRTAAATTSDSEGESSTPQWDESDILVIGPTGGLIHRLDPSNSATPIQDAIDAATAVNGGEIRTPPKTVTEAAPLRGGKDVRIKGVHPNVSTIEFTDLENDGIFCDSINEWARCEIDGVCLDGSNRNQRTGGSALHFAAVNRHFNLGFVKFSNWIDPTIHFETGHPYASEWGTIWCPHGDGRLINAESGGGGLLSIQNIETSMETSGVCIDIQSGAGRYYIGSLSMGGSQSGAILHRTGSASSYLGVEFINYEAGEATGNGNSRMESIVRFNGPCPGFIGRVHHGASAGAVNHMLRSKYEPNYLRIGWLADAGVVNGSLIEITDDLGGPLIYNGPAADVDNQSGSAWSHPVVCLSDVTKKLSTGSGYDGGTVDSQL